MSAHRLLLIVAAASLLAACETTSPGPPAPPPGAGGPPSAAVFRAADFSWSAVPGRNRIDGKLTYRRGATRYTCAGASVLLTPETLWTRRRMTTLYNSPEAAALPTAEVRARTPSEPSADYSAFVRRTTCNAADEFSFVGLPDGAWFAITVAKPSNDPKGESMAIMRRVMVKGGKATPVVL